MKVEIPDTELMAEQLGMIVLCENCGKRLKRRYVARIPAWEHEATGLIWCGNRGEWSASARKGPLAIEMDKEPK